MKAVYIKEFGGPQNLEVREVADLPKPQGAQVFVRVRAAALNRADLFQRRGLYPAPQGYSQNIPGLEFAGEVVETGTNSRGFSPCDRVFGITAGEAQAENILIDSSHLARIPDSLNFVDAAAIPEAFITAYDAVFTQGRLGQNETLLIHAVGSGVGLAALQLAKANGNRVFGTSRTADKLEKCSDFGLDEAILAGEGTGFAAFIREKTDGKGVDVILDLVGASYLEQNLQSLASKGRLLLVGLTSGRQADLDMGLVLSKRLTLIGTVLRGRSTAEKAAATDEFVKHVLPLIENGIVRPNVDKIFPVNEIRAAHEYLELNVSFGKVVIEF